jgi:HPt (histidine-containing phosphotransfer) domain-containing protein
MALNPARQAVHDGATGHAGVVRLNWFSSDPAHPTAMHNAPQEPAHALIASGRDAAGAAQGDGPVFDAQALGCLFDHDTQLIAGVLRTFATATAAALTEMQEAMAARDLEALGALAHKITGASRLSGAHALGHCAQALETATRQGDARATANAFHAVLAQWPLVLAAIEPSLQEVEKP